MPSLCPSSASKSSAGFGVHSFILVDSTYPVTLKQSIFTRFGKNTFNCFLPFFLFSLIPFLLFLFYRQTFEQVICSLSLHFTSCLFFIFHHGCFAKLALPNFTRVPSFQIKYHFYIFNSSFLY